MRQIVNRVVGLLTVAAACAAAVTVPDVESDTQQAIAAYLARYPGEQTGRTEVTFNRDNPSQEFVVTFQRPAGQPSGPDCPQGWLCLYDGAYFGYPRARLRLCGYVELAPFGWQQRVDSVDDELIDIPGVPAVVDKVWFMIHPPSGQKLTFAYIPFSVDGWWNKLLDTPFKNQAEYLYRKCDHSVRDEAPLARAQRASAVTV